MAKVIVFGVMDTAELAHFYLESDSEHEVVAFCVHERFISNPTFKDLPVIAFENVEELYPPSEFVFFAPMTGKNMNRLRQNVYQEIKQKGFQFISYISSKATIYEGTPVGENCFILEDNTIQPFTSIGNNVVLWSGNHIGHHSQIKDHCFFTSHVVLSGHCVVEENCFLGVNSTIRDYTKLAKGTLVGMSASITKDTAEWGVYVGNPAVLISSKSYDVY